MLCPKCETEMYWNNYKDLYVYSSSSTDSFNVEVEIYVCPKCYYGIANV